MFRNSFRGKQLGSGSADGHYTARKRDRYGGADGDLLCGCHGLRPLDLPVEEKWRRHQWGYLLQLHHADRR